MSGPAAPVCLLPRVDYDLCTGLGTPNGQNLINALAGVPDALGVSPAVGFAFNGPYGGPFNVAAAVFQLTNSSSASLNWSLMNTSLWLKADFTNGTLAAHTATSFNLSLTLTASNLLPGYYTTTLAFTDLVSHAVDKIPFAFASLSANRCRCHPLMRSTPTVRWEDPLLPPRKFLFLPT